MRGLLKFLLPKKAVVPERKPRILGDTPPALSPTPELDEQVREQRGIFMQEVVKMEHTAADIRMALSRRTLDIRARPH